MTLHEVDLLISLPQDNRYEFLDKIGHLLSPHVANILQGNDEISRFVFEDCVDSSLPNLAFDSDEILECCSLLPSGRG